MKMTSSEIRAAEWWAWKDEVDHLVDRELTLRGAYVPNEVLAEFPWREHFDNHLTSTMYRSKIMFRLSREAKTLLRHLGATKEGTTTLTARNAKAADELYDVGLAVLIPKARGWALISITQLGVNEYDEMQSADDGPYGRIS
jgi:hypothetical protein